MNEFICSGYLATEPELQTTQNGKTFCRTRIALRRTEEITDFIPVCCWEGAAKFLAQWFRKGSGIELRGELQSSSWTDADGNRRYRLEVVARAIDFPKSNKREAAPTTEAPAIDEAPPYSEVSEEDENLPFA